MSTIELAAPRVRPERRGEALYLSADEPLREPPRTLGDLLRRAAETVPERAFLLDGAGREVTYGEALRSAEGIAAGLRRRGWTDRAILVLAENSVDHALLMLGAYLAGVPVAPVSAAYSLRSRDYAKLRAIHDLLRPAVAYVEPADPFRPALEAVGFRGALLVGGADADGSSGVPLRSLIAERPAPAAPSPQPGDVAKILFTSGSTGTPKGVPNTHRMLCANQQSIAQVWPFLAERPPVLVDWLPWSHTFGGNHNFHLVLFHRGTLLVDDGKPVPALVERTVANLRHLAPTVYFNVPAGFAALVPRLEADAGLRDHVFSRLDVVFYAGAALPDDLWQRMTALAAAAGREVFLTTAWGSTETSPLATSAHFALQRAGNIGVPVPGVTLKLVPSGDKLEVRVKGPSVMDGYLGDEALTRRAFDDEGFYRIGDALRLADPDDPSKGLLFDGRVAEDFKLTTGTWVNVGQLRVGLLAAASPVLQDLVVAGADRDEVTVLAWPSVPGCRSLGVEGELPALCRAPAVRRRVAEALTAWNRDHPGRSSRVARCLLLDEPASIDAGEITDKGYVNQRATLRRRQDQVERLYRPGPPPPEVIVPVDGGPTP